MKHIQKKYRQILEPHDMMIIEAFIQAFKTLPPDWEFFYGHGAVKKFIRDEIETTKPFAEDLKGQFDEMAEGDPLLNSLTSAMGKVRLGQQRILGKVLFEAISKEFIQALSERIAQPQHKALTQLNIKLD